MQSSVHIRDEQIFPNIRTLLISASKFSFFTLKDEPGNREADSWETAETRNGSTFRSQLPQYSGAGCDLRKGTWLEVQCRNPALPLTKPFTLGLFPPA